MKKKLLSLFTAIMLTVSMLATTVFAANGPMGEISWDGESFYLAYIQFYEIDEEGRIVYDNDGNIVRKTIFSNDTIQDELEGVTYNRSTNTLTIYNLSATNMVLETNVMGDDFTLKVLGDCNIGQIKVWGDGYGGTLNIEGTGTLTVNENNIFDNAIILNAEYSSSALKFGTDVTVNLYAKQDVAKITQVPITSANEAYVFANGQNPEITKELDKYLSTKRVTGFEIVDLTEEGAWLQTAEKVKNAKDEEGIYGSNRTTRYDGQGNMEAEGYTIRKLVYNAKYDAYFTDKSFGDAFGEQFIAKDDFETSDFSFCLDENEDYVKLENIYESLTTCPVYEDNEGNEYAIGTDYNNGEETKYVMDFEALEGLENTYAFTKNTTVEVADLEPSYDENVSKDLYNYTLKGTTFTYEGNETPDRKPIRLIDLGNVWTALTVTDVVPFTTEINPNEPGLTDQMEIYEETWSSGTSVITKSVPAKCVAGNTYSYSITLKAKDGYVFDEECDFIYGGSTPDSYTYTIKDDQKTMILSGFIKDVTIPGTSVENPTENPTQQPTQPDKKVVKAKQPMKVTAKQISVKWSKLKKKNQLVKKSILIKKAQGTVSYTKIKKGSSAKLSINKKTGVITVKKGTKKGVYKIKVKVTAKGNTKYLAGSKIITVKIKVK